MGHRLTAISTRTGDDGSTGLGDGSRVSKTHPRIGAMGEVDELNSAIGLLIAFGVPDELDAAGLSGLQQDLLNLGGELSIPGYELLKPERVLALDDWLASINATLPRLREFVLPGGSLAAAQAHMCRTICRRAERSVLLLAQTEPVGEAARQYLNRLSDLMFVLARAINQRAGKGESMWEHKGSAD